MNGSGPKRFENDGSRSPKRVAEVADTNAYPKTDDVSEITVDKLVDYSPNKGMNLRAEISESQNIRAARSLAIITACIFGAGVVASFAGPAFFNQKPATNISEQKHPLTPSVTLRP